MSIDLISNYFIDFFLNKVMIISSKTTMLKLEGQKSHTRILNI